MGRLTLKVYRDGKLVGSHRMDVKSGSFVHSKLSVSRLSQSTEILEISGNDRDGKKFEYAGGRLTYTMS